MTKRLLESKAGQSMPNTQFLQSDDYFQSVYYHGLQTPSEEIAFTVMYGQKSNPNPKVLGTAEAYFVCHIGQSLIYWVSVVRG